MPEFRKKIPIRRAAFKQVGDYKRHKENLREDFNKRCGYCDDPDSWKHTFYEIDHFVPKKYLKIISESDYENLVYACRHCNNAKGAKWPTEDEKRHNNGQKGFIDPCDPKYGEQFERNRLGEIQYRTGLAEYMYRELKLYHRRHAVIWNLEKLDSEIDKIENYLRIRKNSRLEKMLLLLLCQYRNYIKELNAAANN